MQQQIISLLKAVTLKTETLKEARSRFADRLAPDFSIFDYLRTDEMGLSRCIADLLNPTGKHGQKEVFLEAFLALAEINWSDNPKIRSVDTEKQANGQRRIDIYLKFESGEIIGIENKPWAGDQENQLSDYASFIAKEAGGNKWLLVYLSNNEPSDYSGIEKVREKPENEGKFVQISYARIIEWLEVCACKSKALIVRLFIEELAKFIRINVNGELDMSEENEIKNLILASSESIESAFHVTKTMKSVMEVLLKEFHGDLEESLKVYGFELVWDDAMSEDWKRYCGFGVKFSKEDKFYLRFAFDNKELRNFYWGIEKKSDSIKEDDVIWNQINAAMSAQFGSGERRTVWNPWWSFINKNKEFGDTFLNWNSNEAPWISIKEKKLAGKITKYSGPSFQDSKLRWYSAKKGAGNDGSKAKEFYR